MFRPAVGFEKFQRSRVQWSVMKKTGRCVPSKHDSVVCKPFSSHSDTHTHSRGCFSLVASCPTKTDPCHNSSAKRAHKTNTIGQTKRARKSSSYADPELEEEELECWEPETPAKGKRGGGGARKQRKRVVAESEEDVEADEQDEDSSTDEEEPPPKKKATAAARGNSKSSSSGGAKKKKAEPKQRKGVPIGAKKAKKIYHLDDADLALMKEVKRSNNYFFGGYGKMRYSPAELEEYARKKHKGAEWFESSLRSTRADKEEKRARKADNRKLEVEAALQRVEKYVAPLESLATEQYGDTKLPDSVMVNIMECLAASRQPGGLRGFAEVARDLANASLANWDCYRAAKSGWKALGEEAQTTTSPPAPCGPGGRGMYDFFYAGDVERLPGGMEGGWQWWSDFLQNPLDKKAKELAAALQIMGLKAKGTKVENSLRILGMFGLGAATTVPVQLLRVVKLERSRRLAWDGPDPVTTYVRVNKAIDQLDKAEKEAASAIVTAKARGVAYIRDAMRARGYSSIDELVAAGEAAEQQRLAREAEERAKCIAEGRPLPPHLAPPPPPAPPSLASSGAMMMLEMMLGGFGEDDGEYSDGYGYGYGYGYDSDPDGF